MNEAQTEGSPPQKLESTVALMFLAFLLSGMAGLIYQVVWSRLLTLVIGVSIFAITTVICTFMTGLALGSYVFGRRAERWRNPFLVYGVLEAIIGVYAAFTPWIFASAQPLYAWAFTHFDRFGLNVFRIALSMTLLLLPTVLMGGTLPLLSRAVSRWSSHAATGTGLLYAVNTLGAMAGCFLAGFVLLLNVGIRSSLFIAAAMNLAIAAAVFMNQRGKQGDQVPARDGPSVSRYWDPGPGFILTLFFISGFAALGYEVLWTRALLVYLKASTYAFSLMLSVYLLGIAAGSLVTSRLAGRVRNPLYGLAICQLGIALTVVGGMFAFPHLNEWGMEAIGSRRIDSFGRAIAFMISQASVVLLLPTLFMGGMFPFGVAAYHANSRGVGRSVGYLYAMNTAGNIAGAIVVGFFLISIIGVRHSMVALVATNLLLFAAVMVRVVRPRALAILWPALALLAAVFVHLRISDKLFYESITRKPNKIVFYAEGASDTVAVVERPKQKDRTLIYSDGRGAAGTSTLRWNLYFGHLPALLHPDPEQILHICYGSGNSVLALARHDPERIDAVELSPHVRDASSYFWTNENIVEDPRVNLVIEDGRNFLLGTDRTYDVISLEPPNIYTAGVVNLYTKEFYELALAHLHPGGLMVQWLPTIQLAKKDRGMLIRAFADVFPYVTIWQQLLSSSLLLLGSNRPLQIDVDEVDRRLKSDAMKADLKHMGLQDAYGFLSFFLLGDESVRKLVDSYEPVVDDLTVVDYSIPRFVGSGFGFSIFTYVIGDGNDTPARVHRERMAEYASWGGAAAEIVPDTCQAKRLDRAIRYRQQHRPVYLASTEPISGCPP